MVPVTPQEWIAIATATATARAHERAPPPPPPPPPPPARGGSRGPRRGVGVEKRRAHARGGRGAHEKRVTSHHVVRRTDGWADGGTDRRTEDGQTDGSHRRRCRTPPPPPRSRPPKSTLVVPAEDGSGFKEFGSRVWAAGGSSLPRSLRGQTRNAEARRHGRRRRRPTRASRDRRGACRARRTHLEAWGSLEPTTNLHPNDHMGEF